MDSTTTTTAAMPATTRTPEDRARLLAAWAASGLSAAQFAPRAGVTAHTLYAWRCRARAGDGADGGAREPAGGGRDERGRGGRRRRADADAGRSRAAFAELVVRGGARRRSGGAPSAGATTGVAIADSIDILLAGVVVRTTRDFDATHLRRVLELVRTTA